MKIRIRQKLDIPVHVMPGDTLRLSETKGGITRIVMDDTMDKDMILDECATFEIENGDIPGAIEGVGGVFFRSEQ